MMKAGRSGCRLLALKTFGEGWSSTGGSWQDMPEDPMLLTAWAWGSV